MNKAKITWLAVFLMGSVAGYVLSHPLTFHLCEHTYSFNTYTGCADDASRNLGIPLLIFSLWAFAASLIASVSGRFAGRSWTVLTTCFIPVALLFIVLVPVNSTHLLEFHPFYRADAARVTGELFSAATIILVAWNYLASRREKAGAV